MAKFVTPEERVKRDADICAHYGLGYSVAKCAKRFELKRQRVIQILQGAGVWQPYEKSNRQHHLGVVVSEETKLALAKRAEEEGTSVSRLASDALDRMVATEGEGA